MRYSPEGRWYLLRAVENLNGKLEDGEEGVTPIAYLTEDWPLDKDIDDTGDLNWNFERLKCQKGWKTQVMCAMNDALR